MAKFVLKSEYQPRGDQPQAIRELVEGIRRNDRHQVLLGVTGSGKTFTMANVLAQLNKPVLVISHNKTLAAQLYEEFRELFPDNAVEYFVSYYDYYQPEAYIPQRDIYIEKDASRNADLDRLRLSTTTSLSTRRDCIVVSSVSCIFGLGSPEAYQESMVAIRVGDTFDRNTLLGRLADIQYARNDIDFQRGTFRVRGDVVELHPSYESFAVRIEFFGDEIEAITYINPVSGETLATETQVFIYPAQHYVMPADRITDAVEGIRTELEQRLGELRSQAKLLEAQRLQARTMYDIEMIQEVGYCSGIENYARHLAGLPAGAKPYTLIDYFPDDFLLFIDESHVTIPQLRAMWAGDRSRKEVLVEPEGTQREVVTNGLIRAGETASLDANTPAFAVPDSQKLLLSITPSLVAQSINGVDDLLGMPYGCGEQNMIFFAPDVEILRYLNATGQLTPEVRAKAEHFITVGYQRELTFRHADGAFSAFGESDAEGSLWLTAFVLGSFSVAREVTTIDETILADAAGWIEAHQLPDGSWEPVGFVCHSEMVGGLQGNYALTAFVAIAMAEYGMANPQSLEDAARYLRDNLSSVQDDAYAIAIAALAFARLDDPTVDVALDRLLALAMTDADGFHWQPHAVETTAYAALAMIERDWPQANEAVEWLSLQRNSLGGYASTQDTVMGLKALMMAARTQSRGVDLTVTAKARDGRTLAQFDVDSANFDVLQTAELPLQPGVEITAAGSGQVRFQLVRRFNVLLSDDTVQRDMTLEVTYDADQVEVDDIVNVTATVRYFGLQDSTGMMIVDVGVPTGFATVAGSLDALLAEDLVTRYEVAGRKVIFYLDGLERGEERALRFQVKARFPVRATIPDSQAYSY